jgi:hypothetical protein
VFDRIFRPRGKQIGRSKLTQAMRRVAQEDSPKARRALYEQLLKTSLLLPKPGEPGDPEVGKSMVLRGGSEVQIITVRNPQGQPIMAAFTDPGALLAWRPEGSRYVALRTQDALSLAIANGMSGVIINPSGPVGGELTRREMIVLAEGGIPEPSAEKDATSTVVTLPEGAGAYIGPPTSTLPAETQRSLAGVLRGYPEIVSAYLFETVIGGGERHLAIGLQFDTSASPGRENEIITGISQEIGPTISAAEYIDLVILDRPDLIETVRGAGQELLKR